MKPKSWSHCGAVIISILGASLWGLGAMAGAQQTVASDGASETAAADQPKRMGVPQDWSDRHLVFSRDSLAAHPELLEKEPRVLHHAMQRFQAPGSELIGGTGLASVGSQVATQAAIQSHKPAATHRDWNLALPGRLDTAMYPAKYSFDASAPPSCANDYVVLGLSVAGTTGGSANLVGLNNLYSGSNPTGICGSAPTVLFAYNTTTASGGKIVTSPILSEDGTKIGFVESTSTSAIFHVVTWRAGQGSPTVAAAPSMTTLTFSASAGSTSSSPWIDYSNDVVYLGADNGVLYKITGVFKGTPTLAGAPWPVTVSSGYHLTPPVVDSNLDIVLVGSGNGDLYQIGTATGAMASLQVGADKLHGIQGAPVLDIGNGTVFAVDSDDGSSAVIVEADSSSMTQLAKARIGLGSATPTGGGTATAIHLYEPAFSNGYFTTPADGVLRLCGTGQNDITPWQYAIGFIGRTMQTTPSFSQQLLTSVNARCTGWTEFYNPNVNGGTDYFFFGLNEDCTASGVIGGCLAQTTGNQAPTKVTIDGGPSGIVVDNYSTAAQASSVYFSAERSNTVYKFTQNGLQ